MKYYNLFFSDAKYAVVATALEKQRAVRLSSAPFNDRQVMEFERSTVLWQIEVIIQYFYLNYRWKASTVWVNYMPIF